MKKTVIFFVLLFVLFGTTACSKIDGHIEENCINLCDYKNISVDSDYLSISSEEIETIISMDFSSNNYYKLTDKKTVGLNDTVMLDIRTKDNSLFFENIYYEVGSFDLSDDFDKQLINKKAYSQDEYTITLDDILTEANVTLKGIYKLADPSNEDDILGFYKYDSMDEAIMFIKKRASEEILYNYMLNYILENSQINYFPESIESKISDRIQELTREAAVEKKSVDKYLEEYNTNIENIKSEMYNYYYELLIYEAILKQENLDTTTADVNATKQQIALENSIEETEIYNYLSEEELYFYTINSKVRKILLLYATIKKEGS